VRFLADECCPRQVVDALRKLAPDVVFVAESLSGAADPEVAATAIATRGQGLLTQLVLIDANAERMRPLGVD